MSSIAEIHGKSPFTTFEDYLTADVFTAFKYIPPHVGLVKFLRTIEGVADILPEPDESTVCEYHFWPWAADTYYEPDLLVEVRHKGECYHVLFEMKYCSGLSYKEQLVTQYEGLVKGEYLVHRDGWNSRFVKLKSPPGHRFKVYLTGSVFRPMADMEPFFEHYREQGARLFWTSWYAVWDFFSGVAKEQRGFPTDGIVQDILELLHRKGFSRFRGITRAEDMGMKTFSSNDILRYIDQLYREVGQLFVEIERGMAEQGFAPLPQLGNSAGWVNSDYTQFQSWRMKTVSRLYVPADVPEPIDRCILCLVTLDGSTDYQFPTMLCGVLYAKKPLTYAEMYDYHFYWPDRFKTLNNANGEWKDVEKTGSWYSAKPGYRTELKEVRGHILDLFDLINSDFINKSIIPPITDHYRTDNLTHDLILKTYPFMNKDHSHEKK